MTKAQKTEVPEVQLRSFIAKFAPANQRLIRGLRNRVRALMPTANELVYDNYNFLVIAYCPSLKTTDSFFSLAAQASGVTLAFGYLGTKLPDPKKILLGEGKLNRFVRLPSVDALDEPAVRALIEASTRIGKVPLRETGEAELVIRSISPTQRPRR